MSAELISFAPFWPASSNVLVSFFALSSWKLQLLRLPHRTSSERLGVRTSSYEAGAAGTAIWPRQNPRGRSNMRIRGWMDRADQTTKIKGMFVRPEQIAEIGKRHPALGRLRLVVTRAGETDVMTLKAESSSPSGALKD